MKHLFFTLMLTMTLNSVYAQAFRLYVYAKDCQGIGTCDGSGIMRTQGGTPPYQIDFEGNTENAAIDTTRLLCEGVYSATATDANDQTSEFYFVVGSPQSSHINLKGGGQVPVDTLYENAIENCDVDYDNIDSVRIIDHDMFTTDSIDITWKIYQTGGASVVVNQKYSYPKIGLCRIILYLYCSGGARAGATHVRGVDEIVVEEERSLSINTINENDALSFYPNPFSEKIVLESDTEGALEIIDVQGKVIYKSVVNAGKTKIDTGSFTSGVYIVSVKNNKELKIARLIK